ncbi:MAG: cytochrome c [Saprospiraceae bacterium]|nr:cytochrome c [Saprospiraceae bacterium]
MLKYYCVSLMLLILVACGGATTEEMVKDPTRVVYTKYCMSCHGPDGKLMSSGAKDLSISILTEAEVEHRIRKGSNNKVMMAYEGILKDEQIKSLTQYVLKLRK